MADDRAPLALYHILDATEDFLAIVGVADSATLAADRTRRYAAERCIEIISEGVGEYPTNGSPSIP